MAVSRRHSERRAKLRKDGRKREKWVARKLVSFNALPTEAQEALMRQWAEKKAQEDQPVSWTLGETHED